MYKLKIATPFILLLALLALLWHELFYAHPALLPSPLIGAVAPRFTLENLFRSQPNFSHDDLQGQPSLVNVWATWCYACKNEHAMLLKIKNQYHIPIYSVLYKDDPRSAIQYLVKFGNPYVLTGVDKNGSVAIDFGVYGTPETFVISSKGTILYKHIGAIDQKSWEQIIYPLLKNRGTQ